MRTQQKRMKRIVSAVALGVFFVWISPPAGSGEEGGGTTELLVAQIRPSVVTIRVLGRDGDERGIGTGFVVDPAGLIATNLHVIHQGRPFSVETSSGRELSVVAVEASERASDLALIRVDVQDEKLKALPLAGPDPPQQGTRVLAFGNPLGLQDSVVEGVVSAVRDVEGREMIQLAMPIEPGNSGGPVVDRQGRVHGIVNMKSAVDDNLGFAIPIGQLAPLRENPNPVSIDRWTRWGTVDPDRWATLFGAVWRRTGGTISAHGRGSGFGGRSLCLSKQELPDEPFEIAVMVRLNDESGAAGLAFHSDGDQRHYGFYPSGGRLRLTCFRGPSVYSWQVLQELKSEHYLPDQWNRLRVRIEEDRFRCFVNGHLVIESSDHQLTGGKVGLVKFRDTEPEFQKFRLGRELPAESLSESAREWFAGLEASPFRLKEIQSEKVEQLGQSGAASSQELLRRAGELQRQAEQMRRLAADVRCVRSLNRLRELLSQEPKERAEASSPAAADSAQGSQAPGRADPAASPSDARSADPAALVRGALWIASLDHPEIDVEAYETRIEEMARQIRRGLDDGADPAARRAALDRYLFEKNGFHGSRSEYHHPANSHLNRVIDDREGLPITLSILYMELGRQLGLRIEGIGLPGHFVVEHVLSDGSGQWIDVFDGGEELSRSDAAAVVMQYAGQPLREEDLQPQTTEEILARVLNNLLASAERRRDLEAMLRYSEALLAVAPTAERRLMRAQLRAMTGRGTRAREDLDWLLENAPADDLRSPAESLQNPADDLRRRARQMREALRERD